MTARFTVMTPSGIVARTYDAESHDDAVMMAEADGYEVLDVMDDVIVIPDDPVRP